MPLLAYVPQTADLGAHATQRARFRDGQKFTGANVARANARIARLTDAHLLFTGASSAKHASRAARLVDRPATFVVVAADAQRYEERLRRYVDAPVLAV